MSWATRCLVDYFFLLIAGGGEWLLLVSTTNQIHLLNERAHTFAFDILFSRLKFQLSQVPRLKIWETGIATPLESPRAITDDLPSFSLSPLPYITEVRGVAKLLSKYFFE